MIRISPDGKEVLHLYNDKLLPLDKLSGDIAVERASDIFFDNDICSWRIKILKTGEVLDTCFIDRETAKEHEVEVLESRLREGLV